MNDFKEFLSAIFNERLKQAKLTTNNGLNTDSEHAIKNEEKQEKLQTFDLG